MSRRTTKQRRAARRRKDWVERLAMISGWFSFYANFYVPTVWVAKVDLESEYPQK